MLRSTLGLVLAATFVTPVQAARVNRETFGCTTLASADQLATLQVSDQTAYADSLGRLTRAGQCRIWRAGEQVAITDREDGLVCLSPQEISSLCYWSAPTAVE